MEKGNGNDGDRVVSIRIIATEMTSRFGKRTIVTLAPTIEDATMLVQEWALEKLDCEVNGHSTEHSLCQLQELVMEVCIHG